MMVYYHGNHADDELSNLPTVSLNVHQSPEWALRTEGSVPYKSRQTEMEDTSHFMTMIKGQCMNSYIILTCSPPSFSK